MRTVAALDSGVTGIAQLPALVVQVMLPLTLLVAAGATWHRFFPDVDPVTLRMQLQRLTLYLFYPCILFAVGASTPLDTALLAVPLLVGLGTLLSGALLWFLLYRTRIGSGIPDRTRAVLVIAGMFGNTFNVGAPTLAFFLGPESIRYAVYIDMLMTMPIAWSLGVWVCTRLGGGGGAREPVWRVMLRMPPIWAFLAGVAFRLAGIGFEPLVEATRMIGQATIPVVLFALGMTIPWARLVPRREIFAVAGVKLLVMPAAVWMLANLLFGSLGEARAAAVIESAVPSMMTTLILAARFRLDEEAAALAIGWTTLLYWVTLPALMATGVIG